MSGKAKKAMTAIRASILAELRFLPADDQIAVVEALGNVALGLIDKASRLCESDMSGSLVPR
jgi:hypothetical protein